MMVYVDDMKAPFGRYVMCHMWADTRAELFAMADRIGVARKWFQRPDSAGVAGMKASWEHFDIALTKRALAVAAGAIETDRYGPVEAVAMRDIASGNLALIVRGFKKLESVRQCRLLK